MKKALLLATLGFFSAQEALAENVKKTEFGNMVREYLIANPEVIIESMTIYQKQKEEEGKSKTRESVKANADAIFNDTMTPTVGDKDAKIAVVEFFDYNCGACKYTFNSIDAVWKTNPKDVKVVFKEYPIFGEVSQKLARIGLAVFGLEPTKYYDFHAKMMRHKGSLDVTQAYAFAEELGISRASIEKELGNAKYGKWLDDVAELGGKLDIKGTPFMIIGNEPVPHALPEDQLRQYIEDARK